MIDADWTFNRGELHNFIALHPLQEPFLNWVDLHESIVDWLKLFVEEERKHKRVPVDGAALVSRVRIAYDDVDPEWAQLFACLLVYTFPKLGAVVRLDIFRAEEQHTVDTVGADELEAGDASAEEPTGEGGEVA